MAIEEERMRARWGRRAVGLTLVVGLVTAAAAVAATVPIGGTLLHSNGGTAAWDPSNASEAYCLSDAYPVYSPASNGDITSPRNTQEAFDYGLNLFLAAKGQALSPFIDPDGNGNLKGQTLTVGPAHVTGLEVSRTDAGLPGSPTLRDLVTLQNPHASAFSDR